MHEIITIQLGQRANYLATHFWNTQESYFTFSAQEEPLIDSDVHFRPGIGADGAETFTPRTLIYDLKGGFGSLRKYNSLYEIAETSAVSNTLWDGQMVTQRLPSIAPNEYQRSLDEGTPIPQLNSENVRYWSDFNRVYYHPRSIVQLNDYELNSQIAPFESWAAGEELFRSIDNENDVLDRDLRPFAEECDSLSAFQIFTGTDDAWGGFAARYLDRVRDEFGRKSVWVWASEDGQQQQQRQARITKSANAARSLATLASLVNTYVRLSTPPSTLPEYVNLPRPSDWYQSALLATAVESATLPSRIKETGGRIGFLSDMETIFKLSGPTPILELTSSICKPSDQSTTSSHNGHSVVRDHSGVAPSISDSEVPRLDINFTPTDGANDAGMSEHVFAQINIERDANHSGRSETDEVVDQWERQRRRMESLPLIETYASKVEYPLIDSFPQDMIRFSNKSKTVRTKCSLTSTSRTVNKITNLQRIISQSLGLDEREDLLNDLSQLSEPYQVAQDDNSSEYDDDF